jgi:hypothetical protein
MATDLQRRPVDCLHLLPSFHLARTGTAIRSSVALPPLFEKTRNEENCFQHVLPSIHLPGSHLKLLCVQRRMLYPMCDRTWMSELLMRHGHENRVTDMLL